MEKLTDKHFSFICPMVWDEMPESANGRFCASCRKEVFDLSNCTIDEVRELQRKHGPICGSIKVMRAAAVAASLTAAACHDTAPTRTMGKPLPPPIDEKPNPGLLLGEIAPPRQEISAQEVRLPGKIRLPDKPEGE